MSDDARLRHTTMPSRIQKTPHGEVSLSSRWMRDQYKLSAYGSIGAIRWLFPEVVTGFEILGDKVRHVFVPSPRPVTIERELRRVCAKWQEHWNERLADHLDRVALGGGPETTKSPVEVRTLSQLVDAYLAARVGELAPRTMERNRHYLNRWIDTLGCDIDVNLLDNACLVEGRQRLLSRLNPSTVNTAFAVLKSTMNWAILRGYMYRDPTKGIKPLRNAIGIRERAWWTTDEISKARDCARRVDCDMAGKAGTVGHTAELLVMIGCMLGLRYEEIVMLRWEDVDLDGPEPVCRVRLHSDWAPKDGEERAIPIQSDLAETLRRFRKPSGYILEPKSAKPRRGGQKHTYRYDPQRIWNRIIMKVEEAGGKRISPHGMRHSFASNLLMVGVSDVLVARWLGHANTTMVHKHYGHLLAYHGDINKLKLS